VWPHRSDLSQREIELRGINIGIASLSSLTFGTCTPHTLEPPGSDYRRLQFDRSTHYILLLLLLLLLLSEGGGCGGVHSKLIVSTWERRCMSALRCGTRLRGAIDWPHATQRLIRADRRLIVCTSTSPSLRDLGQWHSTGPRRRLSYNTVHGGYVYYRQTQRLHAICRILSLLYFMTYFYFLSPNTVSGVKINNVP